MDMYIKTQNQFFYFLRFFFTSLGFALP